MSKPTTIAIVEMPARLEATTVFAAASTLPPGEISVSYVWLKTPQHPRPILGVYRKTAEHWYVFNDLTDRDHLLANDHATQPTAWAVAAEDDRMGLGDNAEVLATISISSTAR